MASIFLSYAREDAPKAKGLAKCLERAGHTVWWDHHIHGGSEFSGEIEAALRRSEVVLVLWTDASMRSAWVRDEAAEGRDSGRLVPVLADDCTPPLGFRQIQSISIAGWSGRGNPPNFHDLQAAIAARAGALHVGNKALAVSDSVPANRRIAVGAMAVVAAILIALGGWWLIDGRTSAAAKTPVLAVLPFADLSPARDKAYFTEGVSEAILTILAREPGIKVLGRTTAQQLQNAGTDTAEMRRALGLTHVLEGSARSFGDQLRMSVRLVNADDGQQLWAEEYDRKLGNIFAVQDEIGRAVAQRLKGSFDSARQTQQQLTSADVYTLYLAARSKMRDRRMSSLHDSLKMARQIIASDPDYAPGHALYAELIGHLSVTGYGKIPEQQARAVAERHAKKAIQLAPDSPEGYAALGMVVADADSIAPLTKAIRLDPSRAELRLWLARGLDRTGRIGESLKHFQAVVEMDPLWQTGVMNLAYKLAASERFGEAERMIADYERRGGSAAMAAKIRGDVASYRGDYSEAVRLTRLALSIDPQTPEALRSAAWDYYILGLPKEASSAAQAMPHYTRLLVGGEHERLLHEVRKAGPAVWDAADPSTAFEILTHARDWGTIARLYTARADARDYICKDAGRIYFGTILAHALRIEGRTAEAGELLTCVKRKLAPHTRGSVRASYMSTGSVELALAMIAAVEGNHDQVFARLHRAIDHGVRASYGRGLAEFGVFDALRRHPEYAKVDARLKRLIAAERAELPRKG